MSSDLPLGFRFAPTEKEKLLCLDYKNRGLAEKHNVIIPDADICKCEPRDLAPFLYAEKNLLTGRDGDVYFFSKKKRKHPHRANTIERANQIDRSTREGYWKDVGKDQDIKTSDESLIGTRKSLSFYTGSPRHPSPTEWRMEEYILGPKGSSASLQDDYGLYHFFKRNKVRKNADVPRLNPKADHNESSIKPLEVISGEHTQTSQENNYPQLDILYPSYDFPGHTNESRLNPCKADHNESSIKSLEVLFEEQIPSYQEINYLPGHNNESSFPPLEVADSLLPDTDNSNGIPDLIRTLPMWETEDFISFHFC